MIRCAYSCLKYINDLCWALKKRVFFCHFLKKFQPLSFKLCFVRVTRVVQVFVRALSCAFLRSYGASIYRRLSGTRSYLSWVEQDAISAEANRRCYLVRGQQMMQSRSKPQNVLSRTRLTEDANSAASHKTCYLSQTRFFFFKFCMW